MFVNRDIFQLAGAVITACHDTDAFEIFIIKRIHVAGFQITVNHAFLLICKQKQIQKLLFVFCDFFDSHDNFPFLTEVVIVYHMDSWYTSLVMMNLK